MDYQAFWPPNFAYKDDADNTAIRGDIICPDGSDILNFVKHEDPLFEWGSTAAHLGGYHSEKVENKEFPFPPTMRHKMLGHIEPYDGTFDVDGHKNCTYYTDIGNGTSTPGNLKCMEPLGEIRCANNTREVTSCAHGVMVPKLWCSLPVEGSTIDD